METHAKLTLLLVLCWTAVVQAQWCCLDSIQAIKDKSSISLKLQIKGAINNDLASAAQGLCGVRVKFDHKFLGDLTMLLTSPSGQSIQLVGPIGNGGFTSSSKWNVSFVPCSQTPVPDIGFKAKWDNIQSWGILGKFYSGTYHPYKGCLEDFNQGTVNGTWTLTIIDNENFYDGKVESFCLLFCDQNGINCESCSPNGGVFQQADLVLCEDQPATHNTGIKVQFPGFTPTPSSYLYKYFIIQNDIIVKVLDDADLTGLPPGKYSICGVSFSKDDIGLIPLSNAGVKYSSFKSDVFSSKNGLCADLSKDCVNVSIEPKILPQTITESICKGETYQIGSQSFSTQGNYTVNLKSKAGCDSTIQLNLNVVELAIDIKQPIGQIDCNNSVVTLDISNSLKSPNTQIIWTTSNGSLSDISDPLKAKVDAEGQYKVTLKDGNCEVSAIIEVKKIGTIPDLEIIGDTLNCKKSLITLTSKSSVLNLKYNWADETSTNLGSTDKLSISSPGIYYLTITDALGCSNVANYKVIEDKALPVLDFQYSHFDCQSDSVQIVLNNANLLEQFLLTGPNMFSSTNRLSYIKETGIYKISGTGFNGCNADSTFTIVRNNQAPQCSLISGRLNCQDTVVKVEAVFSYNAKTIDWIGPNNLKFNTKDFSTSTPGRYQLKIVDSLGCTLDTFIDVKIDTVVAGFQLSAGILYCTTDSLRIQIDLRGEDPKELQFSWYGPVGYSSGDVSPWVHEEGLYYVRVKQKNGCTSLDSVRVRQDSLKPVIQLSAPALTCKIPVIQVNTICKDATTFTWTGPNMYTSSLQNPSIGLPGVYKVVVENSNGCKAEKSILIDADKVDPFLNMVQGTLNCAVDSFALEWYSSQAVVDTFLWSGVNNFSSKARNPVVKTPGWYYLSAVSDKGCYKFDSVYIKIDTAKPTIVIDVDSLTCANPKIPLRATSSLPGSTFLWTNTAGQQIGGSSLEIEQGGNYKVLCTGPNGCINQDEVNVLSKIRYPKIEIQRDTITCKDSVAALQIISLDPDPVSYRWVFPNSNQRDSAHLKTSEQGTYLVYVTNELNCTTSDTVHVLDLRKKPQYELLIPKLNCDSIIQKQIILTASDPQATIQWTLPSGNQISGSVVNNAAAGLYKFELVDADACKVIDSFEIVKDTVAPKVVSISIDTLSCLKPIATVAAVLTDPNADYTWIGAGNVFSNAPVLTTRTGGNFTLRIQSNNFCSSEYLITVPVDTLKPNVIATNTNINCKDPRARLIAQAVDPNLQFNWITPAQDTLKSQSPVVNVAGKYLLYSVAKNGCVDFDTVNVITDTIPPKITGNTVSLPCNSDSVQILIQSGVFGTSFIWQGPKNFYSNVQNPFVKDTGDYTVFAVGPNFCSSSLIVKVNNNKEYPTVWAKATDLNCRDTLARLSSIFSPLDTTFVWQGPNNYENKIERNPMVKSPGIYTLKVSNKYGCTKDTFVVVGLDTTTAQAQIVQLDTLRCDHTMSRLSAELNLKADSVLFQWSTPDGRIINQNDIKEILADGAGTYILKIENIRNGCISSYNYQLKEAKSTVQGVDLEVIDPSCDVANDGTIRIHDLIGGEAPFSYSLDGINYSRITDLKNLEAKFYKLYFKDKFGCKYDTLVEIKDVSQLNLDLGNDRTIKLGETVLITGVTNADTSKTRLIEWTPDLAAQYCTSCFSLIAKPYETTVFKLKIISENGCVVEDKVLVRVITEPSIFIPNAISPNGDNVNDLFTIHTGADILQVDALEIYSRWGEMVYSKYNFDPNVDSAAWDGRNDGDSVNPGVFVVKIIASSISGEKVYKVSDLTVIR